MAVARGIDVANVEGNLDAPVLQDSVGNRHDEKLDEKHSSVSDEHRVHDVQDDVPDVQLYGDDVEFPTTEEIATLRRVADKIPIAAFAIVIVELCERFAYYGKYTYIYRVRCP